MGILNSMAQNVANNLNSHSLLMKNAQQRGNRMAAQRGLQNSTLGIEASQRAMIDAAMPIAQIDTQNQFAAEQAGLDRRHQRDMQRDQHHFARDLAQLQGNITYNNQSRLNQAQNKFTAEQAGLDRRHQLSMQTNQQNFAANQANLDRSHQRSLTQLQGEINYNNQSRLNQAQNAFAAEQASLDRSHQSSMARQNLEIQHSNAMRELDAQVSANTIGRSIDFSMQIHNNFDAQIAAVQNNNQMTAKNKELAIQNLAKARNVQLKFLENFMQNIPTTHQGWTNFPSLKFPTLKELPTT